MQNLKIKHNLSSRSGEISVVVISAIHPEEEELRMCESIL